MDSSILRIVWTPRGDNAYRAWLTSELTICETIQFGPGVAVATRNGVTEATWRDSSWQPALDSPCLVVKATQHELQISIPAVWRAHAYFCWRGGCLVASSDLRTLSAVMPGATPALDGVALFLTGGQAESGVVPSLYRDIWQLQPGHSLVVQSDGRWRAERTWAPEQEKLYAALPFETVAQRLQDHLDGLADRILTSHSRVACLFSGGLDSSLVAATLLRREPDRVVLFNVGSGLGTAAEEALRMCFLRDFKTVSHPVDLPAHAHLVQSLRATNAVAPLPVGSPFSHVFEEIIEAAQERGCDVIVTGDGGDEIFAEREEILVDLLARRSSALPAAAAFFALRNGERGIHTLRRTIRRLRALNDGVSPAWSPQPGEELWGEELTGLAVMARSAAGLRASELWSAGWTCSGLGAYRRAAAVPDWEPLSAGTPHFPVASPLVDVAILTDALALRRDALVPAVYWGQRKWLLRHVAMRWLSPEVALHPKIGSADGQILEGVRANEHHDLLDLLTSKTARRAGLEVPSAALSPHWSSWYSDGWIRTAALVAWLDQAPDDLPARPSITMRISAPKPERASELTGPSVPWPLPRRAAIWRIAALAALNVASQLMPRPRTRQTRLESDASRCPPPPDGQAYALVDLARRACIVPFVSGSPATMSRALAWYLRLCGKRPAMARGTAEGTQEMLYWIEVDGSVVDVSGAETPLVADCG